MSRPEARRRALLLCLAGACLPVVGAAATPAAGAEDPCAGASAELRAAAEALDRSQYAEAERRLQPLSASRPDCPEVLRGLARVRAAKGDRDEAERLFARAIALAPGDASSHADYARFWLSGGRPARADYESAQALSLDPDCAEALVVSAQLASLRGRPPAAFDALQKAARVGPRHAEAQYQLGIWLFRTQRHAEAVRQFEKTVALRSNDARAHDYLALAWEAVGEAGRAEEAYLRALAVNEGPFFDSFLDRNYGRFLLKQGRLEEARTHLDRAVALLPESRAVRYERAKLELAAQRYAAAREEAERALRLAEPGGSVLDLQVYYLLATIYARLGEKDLARKYAELARTTPIPNQD